MIYAAADNREIPPAAIRPPAHSPDFPPVVIRPGGVRREYSTTDVCAAAVRRKSSPTDVCAGAVRRASSPAEIGAAGCAGDGAASSHRLQATRRILERVSPPTRVTTRILHPVSRRRPRWPWISRPRAPTRAPSPRIPDRVGPRGCSVESAGSSVGRRGCVPQSRGLADRPCGSVLAEPSAVEIGRHTPAVGSRAERSAACALSWMPGASRILVCGALCGSPRPRISSCGPAPRARARGFWTVGVIGEPRRGGFCSVPGAHGPRGRKIQAVGGCGALGG